MTRCLGFTLIALVSFAVTPASAQQDTEGLNETPRQHSASGKHVQEQIDDILSRARTRLQEITTEVRDYECMLIKQERVNGKMQDMQFLQAKIRHEQKSGDQVTTPFSVYVKFLKPANVVGREVVFVEGRDNGDLIARRGGRRNPNMTFQLEPDGVQAMNGNRYPITEIGFATLVERLIEVMEDIDPENCQIKRFDDAKLDGRACTHFELSLRKKQANSRFMKASLFVDNEYRIPTYYTAHDWPKEEGGKPVLLEAYTYRNIKVNVGLTDADFDRENPKYRFSKIESTEKRRR